MRPSMPEIVQQLERQLELAEAALLPSAASAAAGGDDGGSDDRSGPDPGCELAKTEEFDRAALNYDQFSGLNGVPQAPPGVPGIARSQSEDISPDDWH